MSVNFKLASLRLLGYIKFELTDGERVQTKPTGNVAQKNKKNKDKREEQEDVEDEDGPTQQHKSTTQYHTLVQLSEPYFLRPNANASNERGECSCGNA